MHPLLDKSTLKVHLPNGTFNVVRFGDAADIKGIIQLLTNRLYSSGECRYYQHLYAMRMVNTNSGDVHWLHQDTTMFQVSCYGCYVYYLYVYDYSQNHMLPKITYFALRYKKKMSSFKIKIQRAKILLCENLRRILPVVIGDLSLECGIFQQISQTYMTAIRLLSHAIMIR